MTDDLVGADVKDLVQVLYWSFTVTVFSIGPYFMCMCVCVFVVGWVGGWLCAFVLHTESQNMHSISIYGK